MELTLELLNSHWMNRLRVHTVGTLNMTNNTRNKFKIKHHPKKQNQYIFNIKTVAFLFQTFEE